MRGWERLSVKWVNDLPRFVGWSWGTSCSSGLWQVWVGGRRYLSTHLQLSLWFSMLRNCQQLSTLRLSYSAISEAELATLNHAAWGHSYAEDGTQVFFLLHRCKHQDENHVTAQGHHVVFLSCTDLHFYRENTSVTGLCFFFSFSCSWGTRLADCMHQPSKHKGKKIYIYKYTVRHSLPGWRTVWCVILKCSAKYSNGDGVPLVLLITPAKGKIRGIGNHIDTG